HRGTGIYVDGYVFVQVQRHVSGSRLQVGGLFGLFGDLGLDVSGSGVCLHGTAHARDLDVARARVDVGILDLAQQFDVARARVDLHRTVDVLDDDVARAGAPVDEAF